MRYLVLAIVILAVSTTVAGAPREEGAPLPGSVLADSLAFPGEVHVITSDQLKTRRINTLDDILEMLPGVSWYREGPTGASTGMSVDGRPTGNPSLMVNGRPFTDPWSGEALGRFVPLSRLVQVEVVYSASPSLTQMPGSGSVINLVIEEGGRKGPIAVADFSNGKGNRRARRFWFSTPESFINLTIAYDEYLEDASFPSLAFPEARIGQYDSRSVLTELKLTTDGGDEILLHLQKYEDTFGGTESVPWAPPGGEETRYSGVDSRLEFRRGNSRFEVGQRLVEVNSPEALVSGMVTGVAAGWRGSFGGIDLKPYLRAERGAFENRIAGLYTSPEYDDMRLGLAAGGRAGGGVVWRAGIHGGYHSEAETWIGGEAGISRGEERGFYQNLLVSRNLVLPSARSFFNPVEGESAAPTGNLELEAGVSDEVSIGLGFTQRLSLTAFARREELMAYGNGEEPESMVQDGTSDISGIRGRVRWDGSIMGLDYGISLYSEYYGDRSTHARGTAEYAIMGGVYLSRRSFKETETVSLRLDGMSSGERSWGDRTLGSYSTADLSFSITVMSAIIQVQYKNLFDSEYEIWPGYVQHGRHIRYGFVWNILD